MYKTAPLELPDRPPPALYLLALALGLTVFVLAPERLIRLGPMAKSLTNDIASVRRIAYLEVLGARIGAALAAAAVIALIARWGAFVNSRLVQALGAVPPPDPRVERRRRTFANASAAILWPAIGIILALYAFGDTYLPPYVLKGIYREGALLENGTALLFAAAAAAAAGLAVRLTGRRRAVFAGFAVLFLICVGEEISWGQWLFYFEPPQTMTALNVQNEINLHNVLGYMADHIFIAAVFLYGVGLPVLRVWHPFWRAAVAWTCLPVASYGLATGFLGLSALHRWIVGPLAAGEAGNITESREWLAALALLLLMREAWAEERDTTRTCDGP